MKVIGFLTTVLAMLTIVGALVVLVASVPDIKRYLKMRAM